MKRNQKEFLPILTIIALLAVIILAVIFLSVQKRRLPALKRIETSQTTPGVPAIQNANDLNTTASELDNTNLDVLNSELIQLETDISSF